MPIRRAVGLAVVALLAAGGTALAAISWATSAELSISVGAAPSVLAGGAGASKERYVDSFALSANLTSFSATLHPRFGAAINVKDVFRVVSNASEASTVTLSGTPIGNPQIFAYTWTVKDAGTTIATLDMRSASPSAPFTLPTGATYKVDLRIQTAEGAGAHNADLLTGIQMRIS